jgi:hypothetical protein
MPLKQGQILAVQKIDLAQAMAVWMLYKEIWGKKKPGNRSIV